jgi:hypothetical protein
MSGILLDTQKLDQNRSLRPILYAEGDDLADILKQFIQRASLQRNQSTKSSNMTTFRAPDRRSKSRSLVTSTSAR